MITGVTTEPMEVKIEVASNPDTSSELLAELANDKLLIRYLVFLNPNTPKDVADAIDEQMIIRRPENFHLGVDFSHNGYRDSETIYRNVKQLIKLYGGEFQGCDFCSLDTDYDEDIDDEFEQHSNIGVRFAIDIIFFEVEPNIRKELDLHNWVADEIESMLMHMGYEYIASDWF